MRGSAGYMKLMSPAIPKIIVVAWKYRRMAFYSVGDRVQTTLLAGLGTSNLGRKQCAFQSLQRRVQFMYIGMYVCMYVFSVMYSCERRLVTIKRIVIREVAFVRRRVRLKEMILQITLCCGMGELGKCASERSGLDVSDSRFT